MKQNLLTVLQLTAILLTLQIAAHAQPTLVTEVPNASTDFFAARDLVYLIPGNTLPSSEFFPVSI